MEAPLQQRIVGAIVLVTLGVIFIPALLDGSGYRSRQVQDIQVKPKPEFPPLTQKKLKPVSTPLEENRKKIEKQRQSDKSQADKKPIRSFALQVGTFSTNENAEKMRSKLKKAGYSSYTRKTESDGKTRYTVRVGPDLDHAKLEKIREKLKKSHKIDGYIVNHP